MGFFSRMPRRYVLVVVVGVLLRAILLAWCPQLTKFVSQRPEFVTPLTSFARVREAFFLWEHHGDPYEGDAFHQPPLLFAGLYGLLHRFDHAAACALFIGVDVLTGVAFARLCHCLQRLDQREQALISSDNPKCGRDDPERHQPTNQRPDCLQNIPVSPMFEPERHALTVLMIYFFNPYTLLSCCALSTNCFTQLAVVYSLMFAIQGEIVAAVMSIACGTYLAVYPLVLLIPVHLLLLKSHRMHSSPKQFAFALGMAVFWISFLLLLSKHLCGGWQFIEETYLWVAKYQDLSPNVGIFWYFFMEVFDRFREYFLLLFHVHPLIYIVPIYLRMSNHPQAYATVLIGILTLFQAYPSFSDFGFFVTCLSLHPKTLMFISNRFVFVIGIGVATSLLAVMWFLWLYPGSGNANFYYNQTIVYQIFYSQIICAFVGASMKHDKLIQQHDKWLAKTTTTAESSRDQSPPQAREKTE